ncbi:MAG: 5-formyltetrahydrofolate cyclo-ligase [Bacillota bacterium]|nr:5-formyltetrahydrofolate cyclo-ligase [Bacillota bacterium]
MKAQYRRTILKERDSLSPEFVRQAEEKIATNFFNSEFSAVPDGKSVMLYAAFRNEVGTSELIEKLSSKGIKVVLPKTSGTVITPYEYLGPCSLKIDSFGISVPDENVCPAAVISDIHTVIVPGVVFDRSGNRIGFGKGCYDRFLPRLPHAVKIGLCYDFQIVPSVPVSDTDIPMDFLLTEKGFIFCR